jgi:hypothetical protein
MKNILSALGFFVLGILLLPGLIQPPADAVTSNKAQVKALAHALGTALLEYHEEYGQFPEGEQGVIMKELRGGNSRHTVFFECSRDALNDHGEIVDPWGTPFRITFDHAQKLPKIHSAGANLIFEGDSAMHKMMSDDFHSWR